MNRMEMEIPRQGMHVIAWSIRTDGLMGFGTVIKPYQPVRISVRGERRRYTTPVMKLVRHGKVSVVTERECYWKRKGSTTLADLRK